MINPELVGSFAGFLTTVAYIPQTLKILRSKHTTSISLWMYCMLCTGIMSWCIYGYLIGSASLMVANGIASALTISILIMKIRHG